MGIYLNPSRVLHFARSINGGYQVLPTTNMDDSEHKFDPLGISMATSSGEIELSEIGQPTLRSFSGDKSSKENSIHIKLSSAFEESTEGSPKSL